MVVIVCGRGWGMCFPLPSLFEPCSEWVWGGWVGWGTIIGSWGLETIYT